MIGIDEVGRGAWAGPLLVVAARQLSDLPEGLTDSKLLSADQREKFHSLIIESCAFGEGWVTAEEIDEMKLSKALKMGVSRALKAINALPIEEIIMDGSVNYVDNIYIESKCQIKADVSVPVVSAASIYAKVVRDKFMKNLAKKYPDFGFDAHVGYGTKKHVEAISSFGALSGVHRLSFKPVALMMEARQ
jgi:ribonuclease HII